MPGAVLEAVLHRDRVVVGAAIAAITALAWAYLFWLAHSTEMHRGMALVPDIQSWDTRHFGFMFAMWAVMMVGMMLPSAAPMILLYARVGRQARNRGRTLAATSFFAGGYVLAWTAFSAVATAGQWALEQALLLSPTLMATTSVVFGGLVLIAAGVYQWTSLKDACLTHCQSPVVFIQRHGGFRRDAPGSLGLGFRHGLYCIGCCWALMLLLFVGGVMNLLWIAGLALFVLLEKVLPAGSRLPRAAGLALVAAGSWLLVG